MGMMIDTLPAKDALAAEAEMLSAVADASDLRRLWFWASPQALVAPRKLAAQPAFAAAAEASARRGWPVFLRGSGGDVTPQGAGIVNVTHIYRAPGGVTFDIAREYDRLCRPIEAALGAGATRGWMPGAFCDGAYNVQHEGRKFAGTAMRFRPSRVDPGQYVVLAHALMLIKPPKPGAIEAINQFLSDLDEPRVIEHARHTGLPDRLSPKTFLSQLHAAFDADPELADTPLQDP